MKRLLISLSICLVTLSARSGEIDWERASFGITANYQVPIGDFGTYWNNSTGIGGFGRYEVIDRVYLMGTITLNYYTPAGDTGGKSIPHLWLVNVTGSIHYEVPFSSTVKGLLGIGGDNFTFIFRGTPAERLGPNYIESEVALHAEIGMSLQLKQLPRFDIFTRYSSIFSYPDQIPIWLSGVYVYF